jgi:hypothetical protein
VQFPFRARIALIQVVLAIGFEIEQDYGQKQEWDDRISNLYRRNF